MFQGHPPQILENTSSSTTVNEPPRDVNQTNTATHNSNHHNGNDITRKISNKETIKKALKTTKSLNQKEKLL